MGDEPVRRSENYSSQMRTVLDLHYPDSSEQMISIFIIIAWHIVCFQMQCLSVQCQGEATYVHKNMSQTLNGLQLSQWHPELKQMRSCHCCLHEMVSHQLVFVTMPMRSSKLSFIRSAKML